MRNLYDGKVELHPSEAAAVLDVASVSFRPGALLASVSVGVSRAIHDGDHVPIRPWQIRAAVNNETARGQLSTEDRRLAASVAGQLAAMDQAA